MIALYLAYQFYQKNNLNGFMLSEANLNISHFQRDDETKYSEVSSYKITSNEFNDAMFSKEIGVEKNTPYKVTCMVKTKGVTAEEVSSGIGAQISITDTTERSVAISGDNDWQKIELIFNSKNRTTIDIGFRLGGVDGLAKGEAWFSDFKIEQGQSDNDNNWNMACFIFENTNVNINNNQINIQTTSTDITDIKDTINRFEKACNELSEGKMTAECDIYQIQDSLRGFQP